MLNGTKQCLASPSLFACNLASFNLIDCAAIARVTATRATATITFMAATNGTPSSDPLALFRKAVAAGSLPISSSSAEPTDASDSNVSLAEASYLIFNFTDADSSQHIPFALTQPTRFISQAQSAAIDLRSIYFCYQNKDKGAGDYISAVSALNNDLKAVGKDETVTNLVFAEKLDLVSWLGGEIGEDESEFIRSLDDNKRTRKDADAAARIAEGGEDVEMQDAPDRKREEERLREIYAAERKMGDRNTLLRGSKIQDFSAIRMKYAPLFLGKQRSAQQTAQTPTLTNNPALRPPVKAASGRRPEPIILLSPSASSLLRMPNIKSFLVDGIYTNPDSGSAASNILHLTRALPTISSQPMRFILVDSPDQFRPDYWNRVVAVFTTGQTWQFKNYKWQNPAELFANALGVYVGWKGEVVPDTVRGWGRGVLTVQIDKGRERWRDREVVEDVWSAIEGRMKATGWGRDAR